MTDPDPLAPLRRFQRGHCANCAQTVRLLVDHDHQTGLVRGLLCNGCNIREGKEITTGVGTEFAQYRSNPPAARLGLKVLYGEHPPHKGWERRWHKMCDEVRVFCARTGSRPSQWASDEVEQKLGAWLTYQERLIVAGTLPQDRVTLLTRINGADLVCT